MDAQLLERTRSLCRIFLPGADCVSLSIEKRYVYTAAGTIDRRCQIDCKDARSKREIFFDWDANTGALLGISRFTLSPIEIARALTRRDLLCLAARWLRETGIAGQSVSWRLGHAGPIGTGGYWVEWRAADRAAGIEVDKRTGEMVWARVYLHRPQ